MIKVFTIDEIFSIWSLTEKESTNLYIVSKFGISTHQFRISIHLKLFMPTQRDPSGQLKRRIRVLAYLSYLNSVLLLWTF